MSRPLTLMAVHAHPDDEATSTGGVLARYSAEGVTTVLVTCTDGALGDSGTVKPGEEGHSTAEVVALRAAELAGVTATGGLLLVGVGLRLLEDAVRDGGVDAELLVRSSPGAGTEWRLVVAP